MQALRRNEVSPAIPNTPTGVPSDVSRFQQAVPLTAQEKSLSPPTPSQGRQVAAGLLLSGNLLVALVGAIMVGDQNAAAPTAFLIALVMGTPGFGLLLRGNAVVRWGGGFLMSAGLTLLAAGFGSAAS